MARSILASRQSNQDLTHPNRIMECISENPSKIRQITEEDDDDLALYVFQHNLTLKAPRKTASENVVCLCLLNILADFSNLFLHTGKQCGP